MEISRLEKQNGYLFAKLTGKFGLDAALSIIDRIGESSEQLQCPLVLVDACGITGEIGIMPRFDMGLAFAKFQRLIRRMAIVARPDQFLPDRFMQVVVQNRGLNAMGFTEFSEAEAWLLSAVKSE